MRRCYCIRVSFTARKPGTAKFVIKVRKRKYTISANIEDGSSQIDSKKRRCPEKSENDNTALYISDEERREEKEKQRQLLGVNRPRACENSTLINPLFVRTSQSVIATTFADTPYLL